MTAGLGADELVKKFEAEHDDYSAIIVKALADRLAEAFAEYLHARARADWGLRESLDARRSDRREVPRHPPGVRLSGLPRSQPRRRGCSTCSTRARSGIDLTESCAMTPAASVSGLYFWHPQAKYFSIQRVTADQVQDYARRIGLSVEETEKWLRPVLSYDPSPVATR